jgi:CheY-like chemotaxis protein
MAQSSSPTRILLIDDDEMSRELLTALLQTEGYTVTSAESGDAALQLLDTSQSRPAVVLTDMQMPGSTPTQLAGRLRRACGRNTILLAMSGSRHPPSTLARYDGFLLKPFGIADLASAIDIARVQQIPTRTAKKAATPIRPAKPNTAPAAKKPLILDLAASAGGPASKHNVSAAPILDETIYSQLANSMPAPQLREMYAMCLTDARTRIASMHQLAATHDDTQFMRQAHTIKGSCGMLGATELHRLAAALEKNGLGTDAGAVNSPTVAVNHLDELSAACDRLERMLSSRA